MFSTDSSSGPSQVSVTQHFFKTALLNYAVCKKKKKFPQILALEATSIYHLIVSMGRESGSGLAGSFWLRVSPERGLKLLGGGGTAATWCWRVYLQARSPGYWQISVPTWVLAGYLSSSPHRPLRGLPDCLRDTAAGLPDNRGSKREHNQAFKTEGAVFL